MSQEGVHSRVPEYANVALLRRAAFISQRKHEDAHNFLVRFNTTERSHTHENVPWKRVVVVSNRLPFKVSYDERGNPRVKPSDGGLVTAMSPLLRSDVAGKWVGWPGGDVEEGLEVVLRSAPNGQYELGIVNLTPDEQQKYYRGYSNKILSPALEGQLDKVRFPKAENYFSTYQDVQKKFADKIFEDLRDDDIVWVHDFHLSGVGRELKALGARQPVGYFLHMPFPKKEQLLILPHRDEFLRDLLSYDILGFQTRTFRDNFLDAVLNYVPGARVERQSDTVFHVQIDGRIVRVGAFPVSIDAKEFLDQLNKPETKQKMRELESSLCNNGETKMIFSTGRLDYTKGFLEELLAFDRLLEKHPELIGKVVLFQLIYPSRETIRAYFEYKQKLEFLYEKINKKYRGQLTGKSVSESDAFEPYNCMPVRQMHGTMDRSQYTAHLHTADILSIPTKADGMNLVAKEGAVVGKPTMVQVLGHSAGATEELGSEALVIDPDDTEAFADALYEAYTMRDEERRSRKQKMSDTVTQHDVFSWWAKDQERLFEEVWRMRHAGK